MVLVLPHALETLKYGKLAPSHAQLTKASPVTIACKMDELFAVFLSANSNVAALLTSKELHCESNNGVSSRSQKLVHGIGEC